MSLIQKIKSIVNPAGGMFYHYCAYKYRDSRWKNFRRSLIDWMIQWNPESESLLIVGSSGGYTLAPEILMKFKKIIILEPDPVARKIFQSRFSSMKLPIEVDYTDYFSPKKNVFQPEKIRQLFKDYETSAILFSNILGQLPHLFPDAVENESFQFWKKILRKELDMRQAWLSYHDRISSRFDFELPSNELKTSKNHSNSDLVELLEWKENAPRAVEISDHQIGDLFTDLEKNYFTWRIFPGQCHLIEGVMRS